MVPGPGAGPHHHDPVWGDPASGMREGKASATAEGGTGRLARTRARLFEPSPEIVDLELRRRCRLLSSLLFALTLTCIAGFIASPPTGKMINGPLSLLLAGLYGVSRTRRPFIAVGVLLFVGGTHLAATLMLWGGAMSQPYDGQTAWREKFHMDESAVQRLGRSVIRAGVSLPFVLLYAFAPKPESGSMVMSLLALALAGVGFGALVKLKTWGVLALGAAGALMIALAGADMAAGAGPVALLRPALAGSMLLSATTPFLAPIMRWVAAR